MAFWTAAVIITVTAIGAAVWLINNWLRMRHGYPTDEELALLAARGGPESADGTRLLTQENAALKGQVARLEERVAVLERLATDPAERTAREIESLRQI